MRRLITVFALGLTGLLALTGCGNGYDPNTHFATICLDGNGYRVPDTFCPIGDGIQNAGYGWGYAPYGHDDYFDVPYVGYPVNTRVFSRTRPVNITVLNFDRGSFAEAPPRGQTGNAQRVSLNGGNRVTSTGSSTITRGGLGVQSVTDTKVVTGKPTTIARSSTGSVSSVGNSTAPAKRATAPSRKK